MADERDWVRVVAQERCDQCGLAAATVPRADLGGPLRDEAAQWASLLGETDPGALRAHAEPERWSALEYAVHVRDVLALFRARIERVLVEDDPELGWWDHEAAAVDDAYNEQPPDAVAAAIRRHADELASLLEGLDDRAWGRAATRRAGERFTVASLGRFALHETRHHRHDAAAAISTI